MLRCAPPPPLMGSAAVRPKFPDPHPWRKGSLSSTEGVDGDLPERDAPVNLKILSGLG